MSDTLQGFNINSNGYGMIPKSVMQDRELSIAAKALYAYFCSYTGAGNTCFPSRSKICFDLNITNNRLSKHINELTETGYVTIENTREKGRFAKNIYTLPDIKKPCTDKPCTENQYTVKPYTENVYTKSNNLKSNNLKNNISLNKERKKEPKAASYDAILSEIKDSELRELYYEYIKMRQMIKAPMTDRALKTLIKKVNELESVREDRQKQLLEVAIVNNWKSVYPLREDVDTAPKRSQYQKLCDFYGM